MVKIDARSSGQRQPQDVKFERWGDEFHIEIRAKGGVLRRSTNVKMSDLFDAIAKVIDNDLRPPLPRK